MDDSGTELPYDSDRIEFSINPGKTDYEPEDLVAFAGKVNDYFKNSSLLLSAENYSWLDGEGVTYESQDLLDKLIKYKEKYSE